MLADYRLFWSEWRRRFVETGAIMPSSRVLARTIIGPLNERRPGAIRVLEVGAGTGVFTREILGRLRGGDALDVFEINPHFCAHLERSLETSDWRQRGVSVQLHPADIRTVSPDQAYDFIVCGLPLNNFRPADVAEILHLLLDRLTDDGVFSYFEYIGLRDVRQWLIRSGPEHERLRAIGQITREVLQRHQFRSDGVWLNVPPATTHHLARSPRARRDLSLGPA